MPDFVVEHRDGRVFSTRAASAGEARDAVAALRRIHPAHLTAMPCPRTEREWGIPFFMILLAGFTLTGIVLMML